MSEPDSAASPPDYAYLFLTQDGQVRGAMRTYTKTVDLQPTGIRARLSRRLRESAIRTEIWRVDEFILGLSPQDIHYESDHWLPDDGIRWRAGDLYSNTVQQSGRGPDVTSSYVLVDVGPHEQQDASEWFRDYEGGAHRYV